MQCATLAKKENRQSSEYSETPKQSDTAEDTAEPVIGTPVYLHASSPPTVQRRKDDEEELDETVNLPVQAKLTVGEPDDIYEKEADSVADKVMRTPDSHHEINSAVDGRQVIQKKEQSAASHSTVPKFVQQAISSPGNGSPLNKSVRSKVEPVLQSDLSQVRVFSDSTAQLASRSIKARAFTHQNNIFLGKGESESDLELMAHEATHTVQQGSEPDNLQRFEARYHESAERVGLGGGAGGLNQDEITQIYIGNWMRDVNQAFVPTMQEAIPHDVRFAVLKYMGVKKFGQSFSAEQMGFYIPAEHMDSPAGLLQPGESTGDVLTGQPSVNEGRSIDAIPDSGLGSDATPQESVDPSASVGSGIDANIFSVDQTGVMAFMRRTNQHIERRLILASEKGRTPEGMMHFGAALHPIEDLFAHSNWIEIAANKVISENPALLTGYMEGEPQIFTLSGTLPPGPTRQTLFSEPRPILTTGSFATLDTAVSISHEMIGFLREGLHAESNPAVGEAQKELILAFVGQYGGENAEEYVSIIQSVPFPAIPPSVLNWAYSFVNPFLSSYAEQVEAQMAEQKISDTSLLEVREANRRAMRGEFSSIAEQMMELEAQFGAPPVAEQERLRQAEAVEREEGFANTPEHVLAGPSHSQIAKDHSNSIFFGIAFRLATVAVRLMREKMTAVWSAQGDTESYTRERPAPAHPNEAGWPWEEGYVAPWERGIGPTPRTSRNFSADLDNRVQESLEEGNYILDHGHAEGQSYDIDEMRDQSAGNIRGIASKLLVVSRFLMTPRWSRGIARSLRTLAKDLNNSADAINNAESFEERDRANQELTRLQTLLSEQVELYIAGSSGFDPQSLTLGAVMTLMNREVAATAVAYTQRQRDILNSEESALDLEVTNIDLGEPDLTRFTASGGIRDAVHELVMESRNILGHPYEDLWWYDDVYSYIDQNAEQFAEEIRARNAGWAGFRHNESSH